MKYHIKILIFSFLFGLCFLKSYGQEEEYILISDSFLFQNNLKGALEALTNKSTLSTFINSNIDLRKKYITLLSKYQKNFNKDNFPLVKSVIDTMLYQDHFPLDSKKIYLKHFLSSFSRKILTNNERIKYCDEGLSIAHKSVPIDTFFIIHFLFEKGSALSEDNMFKEALKCLIDAETLCSNFSGIDSNMLPKIYFKLGFAYKSIEESKIDKGYEYLQKAEQKFLSLENPDFSALAEVYGILSDIAWNYRDYEKGLNYVKKYKDLNSKTRLDLTMDPMDKMQKKYHFYYKEMQFYQAHQREQALLLVKEAEKDFQTYSENDEIKLRMAAIYNLMGELYIHSFPEKSAPYYLKAIQTLNDRESSYYLQFLFNLGKATLYSGRPQLSLNYSSELIEIAEKYQSDNLPHFYFLKALAYIKLNDFEKALEISNKVIEKIDPNSEIDLITHCNLMTFNAKNHQVVNINLLSRMGLEFLNGLPDNSSALSVANGLFQMGMMEYGKSIKAAKITHYTQSMYEQLFWGIINTKEYLKEGELGLSDLLAFSENTNEKYLWANHKSNSDPHLYFEPELLRAETGLRSELIQLKQEALSNQTEEINQKIFDIDLKLEKIESKKRKSNSAYYDFEDAEFKFETLQSKILPGVLILKYEFILDTLYLFEISNNNIIINKISIDESTLSKVEMAYNMISDPNSDLDSLKQILAHLGTKLLPKLGRKISKLVIKTDRKLNLLPFELLIRNDEYLIKDYTIGYINALGLYQSGAQKVRILNSLIMSPSYNNSISTDGLLAVRGDEFDLSGALEEARLLGDILPGKVLLKDKALKSNFLKIAANYDLLHFSMHSILNDKDPELSNIVFHDGEDDNKLYISELYGMRLNAHLAVLSACNTGIGEEVRGDGIVSLNRAFTFTGIPSVVASLWSAPDASTKEIMIKFYKNLEQGLPKPEALREAKMSFLNDQKQESFKHPYYWAGFGVYGDHSPIEIINNKRKFFYYLIGVGLFIVGILVFRKISLYIKS